MSAENRFRAVGFFVLLVLVIPHGFSLGAWSARLERAAG
jgi:hypothetical protein